MVVVPALGVLPEHGAFRAPLNSGAILPVKVPMYWPFFRGSLSSPPWGGALLVGRELAYQYLSLCYCSLFLIVVD